GATAAATAAGATATVGATAAATVGATTAAGVTAAGATAAATAALATAAATAAPATAAATAVPATAAPATTEAATTVAAPTTVTTATGPGNPCNTSMYWNTTASSRAGTGTSGPGPNQLSSPTGIFLDLSDNLYVADSGSYRVMKYAPGAINGTIIAGKR
ncbi:unnamed protein product, partial [Adineta steineri]